MTSEDAGTGVIHRWLAERGRLNPGFTLSPDDPVVHAFVEFGLPASSAFGTDEQLHRLEAWREDLQIPANSVFVDGTLILTIEALLGPQGPEVITPVTLWELTTFH